MEPVEVRHHQGGARVSGAYQPGALTVHHDPEVVATVTKALRGAGRTVGFVPTMGALHEGHLQLIRQAKRTNQVVIVSIFVNPLQFGPTEDLDAYPRTLDADLDLLRTEGVELVFAPSVSDMYPEGPRTTVLPGPLGAELDGGTRPTHFAGMLTVVAKLLQLTHASEAYFGEKDYQQLTLIRQMVRDLNFDVKIVAYPTVREPDGLALSSRNRYLDASERESALALSAALAAGRHAAGLGPEAVVAAARGVLGTVDGVDLEYLELRDANLGPAPTAGNARLLVAARVGQTRLIDNAPLVLGAQIDGHPDANSLPASQAQ
ncbi:pantoate--beta-alanine ligase [Nocardia mangyaensis]|uniref:Pantothenate synthetase n=1 Tax=Nocardia mangyaensis TaxID=2213200 RepID=A0A1J0VLM6_9NOCA|nr:pantoate--beta-alanine ligase [Nocardia mangyaensis]APE32920.1 pantoate--beta-alanine ligase [Nocardia mangyaensis]